MSPPELATDAPIPKILMPLLESAGVAGWREVQRTVAIAASTGAGKHLAIVLLTGHRTQCFSAKTIVSHADVPLVAEIWLDGYMRSIRVADRMGVVANILKQTRLGEPRNDGGSCVLPAQTDEWFCIV